MQGLAQDDVQNFDSINSKRDFIALQDMLALNTIATTGYGNSNKL